MKRIAVWVAVLAIGGGCTPKSQCNSGHCGGQSAALSGPGASQGHAKSNIGGVVLASHKRTSGVAGPGPAVLGTGMLRQFSTTRSQLAFLSPLGMKVGWQVSAGDGGQAAFAEAQLTTPARYNFDQGSIYRLKLTGIAGRPEMYPTLEVAPSNAKTDAFLTHNVVPIRFTDEDFDQVQAGNYVTKVIYLPDPLHQDLAVVGVEEVLSTRLEPGVDPIMEADRRGTILAVVRMGAIDLETPGVPPMSATAMGIVPPAGMSGVMVPGSAPGWGMASAPTPFGLPGPPALPLGAPAQTKKVYVGRGSLVY